MMKFSAKSSFNKFFEVDDDSENIVCTINKEKVDLNKPIFMGATILDFSTSITMLLKQVRGQSKTAFYGYGLALLFHRMRRRLYRPLERKKEIPYKSAFEGDRVHSGYTVLSLNPKCEGIGINSSNTSS